MILNPYNVEDDRGPCTFQLTHNLSANAIYTLPFTGNPLIEGWQVSGIFYASSGGPFTIPGIPALGSNPGATANNNRADYVPDAPGCNGQPIFKDFKDRLRNGFPGVILTRALFRASARPVRRELPPAVTVRRRRRRTLPGCGAPTSRGRR